MRRMSVSLEGTTTKMLYANETSIRFSVVPGGDVECEAGEIDWEFPQQ